MSKIKLTNDVGILGCLDMDLLWTNSSPTSNFNAQTLNIDFSNYAEILIIYRSFTSVANFFEITIPISDVGQAKEMFYNVYGKFGYRNATLASTLKSLSFGNGLFYENYGGSDSTRNDMGIPYKIYGIK